MDLTSANYGDEIAEIQRRADAINYDIDNDKGYITVCDILAEAMDTDDAIDIEEAEIIEDELKRLNEILFS